ncbi:MAG TPA: O-antigen ligase family protein [Pyrinomonadaceae bacterium]|jgi:O-antigen ligase|nr:O-antigen ligase family protein [Pyrinomonadaceae bacterium]
MLPEKVETGGPESPFSRPARALGPAGFVLYALAAPHSIAGAWIGLSLVVLAWLLRLAAERRTGFGPRTPLDLPLWLFLAWTALSSLLSYEPGASVPKLVNSATFVMFYMARAWMTRTRAVLVASVLVVSGAAGVLWGAGEVAVGRGVVVTSLGAASPLRAATPLGAGDAVWRVNGRRVSSVEEIDEGIRGTPAGARVSLSVISRGEHAEWPGPVVTEEMKRARSPSGIEGAGPTHSFRASGWTRHYETFAEMLQMIAQLALGFALAGARRRGEGARDESGRARLRVALAFAAYAVLAAGIALTAMRTVLVAFAAGSLVLAWRAAARGRARMLVGGLVVLVLAAGALAVWRTRAGGALSLGDASARMRLEVARAALARVPHHPLFGHGMDSAKTHWREWGFPHNLHTHSTPVQLAFERGLPALLLWLWLMYAFRRAASRAERVWRDTDDAAAHGLTLGINGALAGFLASSLVNYNFGDAEAALLLFWLMGTAVALGGDEARLTK